MFHAETSAPSALVLPNLISLSTIESPLTPDGDCVAGYRGSDTEKALDPRRGAPEPSAVTSRASQKRCVCLCASRSRVRLGAVPRHGTFHREGPPVHSATTELTCSSTKHAQKSSQPWHTGIQEQQSERLGKRELRLGQCLLGLCEN